MEKLDAVSSGDLVLETDLIRRKQYLRLPKLLVLETYAINELEPHELEKGALNDQINSFRARRDTWLKIKSTPALFDYHNWPIAWCETFRNHNYIFTKPDQLGRNLRGEGPKRRVRNDFYLGQFARFSKGLSQTTLDRYEEEGAPVDDGVNSLRHAGNYGQSSGGKILRHMGGNGPGLIACLARPDHGKAGRCQQGHIPVAIKNQRRIRQHAQQRRIQRVRPEKNAGIKAHGRVPLLTGRHAPCAASQSGSGLGTQTERRPLRVTLHGGMRGTAGAHQLETGTGPQAPAMPEGEGGPVFLALLGVKFTPARAAPHISG